MHCRRDDMHFAGFALFTLVSVAITIPFIAYAKDISKSLRIIAEQRSIQ